MVGPDGLVRWSYQAPSPGELPGLELLREGLPQPPADSLISAGDLPRADSSVR